MPQCNGCKQELPDNNFNVFKKKNRKPYFFGKCKKCVLLVRNQRRKELREWVENIKTERGCGICGLKDHRCLEFHHLDPATKEHSISRLVAGGTSKKKVLEEIIKCQVICANCHKILHYRERYDYFQMARTSVDNQE